MPSASVRTRDPEFAHLIACVRENIGPTPVSTHVIVGLIWIAIGVTASYVPAARAARLDPSVALREE